MSLIVSKYKNTKMAHDITTNTQINIAQICNANAFRDEATTNRFANRENRFIDLYKKLNNKKITIVSVKEVRDCANKCNDGIKSAHEIWNNIIRNTNYMSAIFQPVKLTNTNNIKFYKPFHMGQLYDPTQVCLINGHCFRAYEDIDADDLHFGCCVLVCLYATYDKNKIPDKYFFVESYHLPISHEKNNKMCDWIVTKLEIYKKTIFGNNDYPTIRTGDFNIFLENYDVYPPPQLEKLMIGHEITNKQMIELDINLKQQNDCLCFTFKPYSYDDYKELSFLDYFFVKNMKKGTSYIVYDRCVDIQMSDHLPLIQSVELY